MAWYFWLIIAVLIIAVLCLAGYAAVGLIFLRYAFMRKDGIPEAIMPKEGDTPEERNRARIIKDNRKLYSEKTAEAMKKDPPVDIEIKSDDGLMLRAGYVKAEKESHRYFILCHGYMGTRDWMMPYAYIYREWGWNSIVVDMRAHGKSEGKWYGMGWDDRKDVMRWMVEVVRRDPKAEIVLQGVSMGGAAVMMALGEKGLLMNLKGVIDDCGFVNVWNVFIAAMEERMGEKAHRILMCASRMHRLLRGWYFQYADAAAALRNAPQDLPVLFLQGENDAFVKKEMTETAYGAKKGEKEIRIFPDTDHGNSWLRWPEEYFNAVRSFLEKHGL